MLSYAKRALQGFTMRMWISNQMTIGQQAWDNFVQSQTPPYGLEYPYASGVEHLFGAGIWVGGIVDGVRHVSEGYNSDNAEKYIRPDPRHPSRERIWQTSSGDSLLEPNRRGYDDDHDGLIDEDDLDGLDNDGDWNPGTDDIGADGTTDVNEVGCHGGYDATTNPDPAFDNFDPAARDFCHPDGSGNYPQKDNPDTYTENNGIPDHGEPHVDEDYAAISDRDLYCSARDDNDPPPGHYPMGIKVIQKSYAWEAGGAILPIDYRVVNMSDKVISNVWLGFMVDADVGPASQANYYNRNYSCVIESLRTAYSHNPVDSGSTPVGLTILGTSRPPEELDFIFKWFNFTTKPTPGTVDSVLYSYMSGEAFPGDLVDSCEASWNPSDTRFLVSTGPFPTFAPGDTLKISIAMVSADSVQETLDRFLTNIRSAIDRYHERILTAIGETMSGPVPGMYSLSANYPNPFNPFTRIDYTLPVSGMVNLTVYNILGQKVAELINAFQEPGWKTVSFDAGRLPSGVYTYRLTAGSFTDVKKMMVLK
jgi:hypothetical protein